MPNEWYCHGSHAPGQTLVPCILFMNTSLASRSEARGSGLLDLWFGCYLPLELQSLRAVDSTRTGTISNSTCQSQLEALTCTYRFPTITAIMMVTAAAIARSIMTAVLVYIYYNLNLRATSSISRSSGEHELMLTDGMTFLVDQE